MDAVARLQLALAATRPGARALRSRVGQEGTSPDALLEHLDDDERDDLLRDAEALTQRGIGAMVRGSSPYPDMLSALKEPPPALFYTGNPELLGRPGLGVCGSRNASAEGLQAAATCGGSAAAQGIVAVSGYARGVDTATHASSLEAGGETIVVLPEGINHFRVKKDISRFWDPARTLVLSQFAPAQTWSAGAAMARNSVIIGLGMALVVVEAGEKGGTLAAGMTALSLGRRVLTLEFSSTPTGNQMLLARGAIAVQDSDQLSAYLSDLIHVVDDHTGRAFDPSGQYALSIDTSTERARA